MFSKGCRPISSDHHAAVGVFCRNLWAKYATSVITAFNQGRKRRSEFQYADAVSETRTKNMIEKAVNIIKWILDY